MATQDVQLLVHTETQVHAETLLAGKEVGPRVTWAGQALPSAPGAPPCSGHAPHPPFSGESGCTTPMFRPALKCSTYIPPPCGLSISDSPLTHPMLF